MLSRTQGLRWSGRNIGKARQRLLVDRQACRPTTINEVCTNEQQFSSHAVRGSRTTPSWGLPSHAHHPPRIQQQYRTLSLFGWGSSAKPNTEQRILESPPSDLKITEPSSSVLEPTRTVKATLGTSDSPDPAVIQPVSLGDHEPAFLKSFEESIATPHAANAATDVAESDIASLPERVGYLKEVCDIDFGWGTTSIWQYLIENLHVHAGLTWGVSVVTLTLVARTLLVRGAIQQQEMSARMQEVQPILGPLRDSYKEAVANQDKVKIQAIGNQIRTVSRESGISMFATFKPILFQIPLSLAGYRLGYHMGHLPVPSLETENFLWITNLALADPWILPIFVSSLTYLTLRASTAATAHLPTTDGMATIRSALQYVLPFLSLFFVHWQPAISQLFFATQALCSYLQASFLFSKSGRQLFKLPPLRSKHLTLEQSSSLSSSAQPTASQPTPATQQISGMNIRSSKHLQPPPEPIQEPKNISLIDQYIEKARSRRDSWGQSWNTTKKVALGNTEKRMKKTEDAKRDQYEYKRRQDEEMERNWRNERVRRKE